MFSRRRIDAEQARARLLALRDGRDSTPGDLGQPQEDLNREPASGFVPSSSRWVQVGALRPVVASIAVTAVVMWVLTHMSTMSPTSVLELATGSPLAGGSSAPIVAPSMSPLPSAGLSSPSLMRTIVVQVIGEVHEPGLVTLPDGARVADAIEAAGGLISRRSGGGLNVARKLVDGEQIVVSHSMPTLTPLSLPSSAPVVGSVGGSSVDLNSADVAALDALPGVGPVMAARIIAWRAEHGRFTTVDQLREVSGIGQRTFERLRPYVHV